MCEQKGLPAPLGACHWHIGARAYNLAAIPISDDDAGIFGQSVEAKVGRDGKIEPVTEGQIFRPFVVGAKVGEAGFNFDHGKPATSVEADRVHAPARCQTHFRQGAKPQGIE